jgi:hypothetical protein
VLPSRGLRAKCAGVLSVADGRARPRTLDPPGDRLGGQDERAHCSSLSIPLIEGERCDHWEQRRSRSTISMAVPPSETSQRAGRHPKLFAWDIVAGWSGINLGWTSSLGRIHCVRGSSIRFGESDRGFTSTPVPIGFAERAERSPAQPIQRPSMRTCSPSAPRLMKFTRPLWRHCIMHMRGWNQ